MDLQYILRPEWRRSVDQERLAHATLVDLHYYVFLGDVRLVINAADLSATWGWVPLLDFASSMYDIVTGLEQNEHRAEVYDFTESEAFLRFIRNSSKLECRSNFTHDLGEVEFEEFRKIAYARTYDFVRYIYLNNPGLRRNENFRQMFPWLQTA